MKPMELLSHTLHEVATDNTTSLHATICSSAESRSLELSLHSTLDPKRQTSSQSWCSFHTSQRRCSSTSCGS
jgi:hypothetical protein